MKDKEQQQPKQEWVWEKPEIKECKDRSGVKVTYRCDGEHVTLIKRYHYCDLLPLKSQSCHGHEFAICEENLFDLECPKKFTIPECPDLRKVPCKIFKEDIYLFCENPRCKGQKCIRIRMGQYCPRGYPA